jgi:tape measure domain-containing protein
MAVMSALLQIKANVTGQQSVDKLSQSLGNASTQSKGLGDAFVRLGNASRSLGGVMASIGAGALATSFARAGVDASRTEKRLANLADQFGETGDLMSFAGDAARRYGIGQTQAANAVGDLYARLRPTGSSLKEIETAFVGVNNAAAQMGLTADQTDNVMLQLSQALGSGKLQGDEFRSVMEQLPTIGQAVAKVMGTTVAGLKELSSDGKITSEVLLKALAELSKSEPPPPDAYKRYQAAVADLSTAVGTQLLPALTPLVDLAGSLVGLFSALPGPVQTLTVAVGGLVAGFVVIAPALTSVVALLKGLAALQIGATIAGWLGAVGPLLAALKGFGALIVAVFTGPVGWVALLVGAGVAIYAFRDQIGGALKAIGQFFVDGFNAIGEVLKAATQAYMDYYVKPVLGFAQEMWDGIVELFGTLQQAFLDTFVTPAIELAQRAWDGIVSIFNQLPEAVKAPFIAVGNVIRGAWNGILTFVTNSLNSFIQKVNAAINLANNLPNVNIRPIDLIQGPQEAPSFAGGGYTGNGPRTGGVDGKGGFPAILHPRERVIDLAAGGVMAGGGGSVAMQPAQININTGPVMQADGQNWVTVADLQRAMRATESATMARLRTYAGRRAVGVA